MASSSKASFYLHIHFSYFNKKEKLDDLPLLFLLYESISQTLSVMF